MLYVLQLADGDLRRQVPLADATAIRLERALLAIGNDPRRAELAASLVDDPALAVWADFSARQHDGASPRTAADAAAWLGRGLVDRLAAAAIAPEDGLLARVPSTEAESFARRHGEVIIAARGHFSSANEAVDAADSTAYWSTIIEAAGSLTADWPVEVCIERRLLPTFPAAVRPLPLSPDERRPTGDDLVDGLLAVEPGIERRLPAVLARLCQCEQLLADFDQRLEAAKLAALKELAYGAGHEINNPLANIAARAQTLMRDEADPERRRKLAAIHRQAMRAHEMIADLMLFARPPQLHPEPCELGELAGQVVDEFAELAAERQIRLELGDDGRPVVACADRTQLGAALAAVVENALEAVAIGGHVEVVAQQASADDVHWAQLVVRDDGPGVSDDVRAHIFDPFFSGREAGRGLGFGLSKCWRIVTDHGGQVAFSSAAGGGCEVTIMLPAERDASVASDAR